MLEGSRRQKDKETGRRVTTGLDLVQSGGQGRDRWRQRHSKHECRSVGSQPNRKFPIEIALVPVSNL